MSKLRMRSAYDFDVEVGMSFDDESLTRQAFLEECDFNTVMHNWQVSGLITNVNQRTPQYADVSGLGDYQASLAVVMQAQASFDALPAIVRDRFGNSPDALLRFLADDSNYAEALKLGLVSSTGAKRPPEAGEAPVGDNPSAQ